MQPHILPGFMLVAAAERTYALVDGALELFNEFSVENVLLNAITA